MKKISSAAALVAVVLLTITGQAFAWSGSKLTYNTCGADLTAPAQNGSWWIRVSDETGVLREGTISAAKAFAPNAPLSIGGFTKDDGLHYVKFEVANAANHADGYVTATFPEWGCAAPVGPPGRDGANGLNGRDGKDGASTVTTKTIIERVAPKTCESRRDYVFRVRRSVNGDRVVKATATEPGIRASVSRRDGRFIVRWSTKGKRYTPGGIERTMTVNATLASGRKVRLAYSYHPCLSKDGNPNDPSASGQGNH